MLLVEQWKKEFAELLNLPIITLRNGLISKLEYKNEHDELHRNPEIGYAYICYYKNGNICYESYWVNSKKHKLEGPAYIEYYKNGNVRCEEYWINNKKHRLEGPARIIYYENGNILYEEYWVNDKIHRLEGPACISYYEKW